MQPVQACKVGESALEHVEGARFRNEQVENRGVVDLARGDPDEARDIAAQVEQRVYLHRRLPGGVARPGKQRHAQIDQRRIQRIDGIVQIDCQGFVRVQRPRGVDQSLRQLRVDAPIALLVGLGKGAARNAPTQAQVIELGRLAAQTGFDVAQALAMRELREGHAQELIDAGEALDVSLAAILRHQSAKSLPRHVLHQLSEHQSAGVHGGSQSWKKPKLRASRSSNRGHSKKASCACLINQLHALRACFPGQ
jgi:hypothetical protein